MFAAFSYLCTTTKHKSTSSCLDTKWNVIVFVALTRNFYTEFIELFHQS